MNAITYEKSPASICTFDLESSHTSPSESGLSTFESSSLLTDHDNDNDNDNDAHPPTRFYIDARIVSDAILGLSDGMTVPFALTAGLSELGDTRVVVLAGLAELVAGAISMGLGGYLGAKSEKEIYDSSLRTARRDVLTQSPGQLSRRITSAFTPYTLPAPLVRDLTSHLSKSIHLPQFLLRFELGVEEPLDSRALTCAFTIAVGYLLGGIIPLLPYLLVGRNQVRVAVWISIVTMVVTLFALGAGKAWVVCATTDHDEDDMRMCGWGSVGWRRKVVGGSKGGLQMVVVGGLSAGCAVGIVRGFNLLV